MKRKKKKKKLTLKKFRIPIINTEYRVVVLLGPKDQAQRFIRRYFEDDTLVIVGGNRGTTYANPKYHPVIYMGISHRHKDFYGTLAHEAVHAVDDIFNYIKDNNRGELFAHSVGAIVREVASNL